MPLRDHFHPPLTRRSWESFHGQWAACIQAWLNRTLPQDRYTAEFELHYGPSVEIDVAEFENTDIVPASASKTNGPVAVESPAAVVTAAMTMPLAFPDDLEIRIYDLDDGKRLVAAIELVSKSNKDSPESRRSFVAKCASYLHKGIGLIVVDAVTSRRFNLHNELVTFLAQGEPYLLPPGCWSYVVGYRPVHRGGNSELDMWASPLAIGDNLPVTPLALLRGKTILLDLEQTYQEACVRAAIP